MLYSKLLPSGDVIVILPVGVIHVGCKSVETGCCGGATAVIEAVILSLHPFISVAISFTSLLPGLVNVYDGFCVAAVPVFPKNHCHVLTGLVFVNAEPLNVKELQTGLLKFMRTESMFFLNSTVVTGRR